VVENSRSVLERLSKWCVDLNWVIFHGVLGAQSVFSMIFSLFFQVEENNFFELKSMLRGFSPHQR
jgi:hypothetical protein